MVATSSASSLCALDLTQSIIALVAPRGLIDGSGQAATLKPAAISGTCARQRRESVMQGTSLAGRSILIVEDVTLVALDIVEAFEKVGAVVFAARSLAEATPFVEHDGLSAAIIDFRLGDDDASALCWRLEERRIPFILHSGYSQHGPAYRSGIVIPKPANPATLIETVVGLLQCPGEETHIMPRDRIFRQASLPPQDLKILSGLFDEVWASVAADFGNSPNEVETAQIRLATIILELATDGQLDQLEIAQTASRLMRKANVDMQSARASRG